MHCIEANAGHIIMPWCCATSSCNYQHSYDVHIVLYELGCVHDVQLMIRVCCMSWMWMWSAMVNARVLCLAKHISSPLFTYTINTIITVLMIAIVITVCVIIITWQSCCRQLGSLNKAQDRREITIQRADDKAFVKSLQDQVQKWTQVRHCQRWHQPWQKRSYQTALHAAACDCTSAMSLQICRHSVSTALPPLSITLSWRLC